MEITRIGCDDDCRQLDIEAAYRMTEDDYVEYNDVLDANEDMGDDDKWFADLARMRGE